MKNRVEKQVLTNKTNRFMELEGLRVVAASVVVIFHALLIFYPAFFYGVGSSWASVKNSNFETILYQNPFAGVLSGTFAVGIFFVLSSFVLSIGFFQTSDSSIIRKLASKRYLRLMLPALASVLIAFIAMRLGSVGLMREVGAITHSDWLGSLWTFPANIFDAFNQGVATIFTTGKVNYNPVLWSIHYEFLGSMIIFGSMLMFATSKYRWIAYAILIFWFINTWFFSFILGMILADVYVNKREALDGLKSKWTYMILLLGIFLGGYPSGAVSAPWYKFIQIPGFGPAEQIFFFISVGATLVISSILLSPRFRSFFSKPGLSGLGKYTYSLYLIHMPILFTVCTGVFLLLVPIGFHKASILASAAAFGVLIPATYIFEKYIDSPSVRFASYCTDLFLGRKELDIKKKVYTARVSLAAKLALARRRKVPEIMPEIEMD